MYMQQKCRDIQIDIDMAVRRFRIISYAKEQNIVDISLKFQDAGHILGSAIVELSFGDKKLVFSGHLGGSVLQSCAILKK
jgi:metallo-beta-lactamase family protein